MKAKKYTSFQEFDFAPGSYVLIAEGEYPILMTLPCGHNFRPDKRWTMRDLDDETKISLSPSIWCSPSVPCWHGYLTNGEFKRV